MNRYTITAGALLAATAVWLCNSLPEPDPTPLIAVASGVASARERPAMATSPDASEVGHDAFIREHHDCDVELRDYVTPGGEMFSAYTCTPLRPPSPHPYEDYTNETLESLAYADALAAALLGQRLAGQDHARSRQMLIRATALDGETRHLAWLGDVLYGTLRRGGELQVDTVMRRYELAALAARLGEGPGLALFLRNELLAAGVDDHEIDRLDARVDTLLERIRHIQLTVFGEVRHGGRNDA